MLPSGARSLIGTFVLSSTSLASISASTLIAMFITLVTNGESPGTCTLPAGSRNQARCSTVELRSPRKLLDPVETPITGPEMVGNRAGNGALWIRNQVCRNLPHQVLDPLKILIEKLEGALVMEQLVTVDRHSKLPPKAQHFLDLRRPHAGKETGAKTVQVCGHVDRPGEEPLDQSPGPWPEHDVAVRINDALRKLQRSQRQAHLLHVGGLVFLLVLDADPQLGLKGKLPGGRLADSGKTLALCGTIQNQGRHARKNRNGIPGWNLTNDLRLRGVPRSID